MKVFKRVSALLLALLLAVSFMAGFAVNTFAIDLKPDESEYTLTFSAGSGKGDSQTYGPFALDEKFTLPNEEELGFTYANHTFSGWSIGGRTYRAGASYTFSASDGSKGSDNQYTINVKAVWLSSSGSSGGKSIIGVYKPGKGSGAAYEKVYTTVNDDGYFEFKLDSCSFTAPSGKKFSGWEIDGEVYAAGTKVAADADFTAVATWGENNKPVIGGDSSSSSSSSTSSSSTSSSTSSSSATSSQPASSTPAPSSSKSSSSVPAPKPSSSSSSESVPEEPIPEPVPEPTPEPEPVFEPTELGYTISGDIPVTKIAFLLNEDIGGAPSLWVNALDSYSATDDVTSDFIASGSVLAAFDLSLLSDGASYDGPVVGVVTYELNGTQADADSLYEENVLALVHVIDRDKFTGNSYYIPDGKKAYLYDVASGNKNEVGSLTFAESDGVSRPALANIDGLSEFAYLADANTIVEVKLIPDPSVSSVSMDVSSLSPFLLAQLEIGKASSGAGIPVWVWIILAVVVLVIVILVVLYLFNRRNQKNSGGNGSSSPKGEHQTTVTGFDD